MGMAKIPQRKSWAKLHGMKKKKKDDNKQR